MSIPSRLFRSVHSSMLLLGSLLAMACAEADGDNPFGSGAIAGNVGGANAEMAGDGGASYSSGTSNAGGVRATGGTSAASQSETGGAAAGGNSGYGSGGQSNGTSSAVATGGSGNGGASIGGRSGAGGSTGKATGGSATGGISSKAAGGAATGGAATGGAGSGNGAAPTWSQLYTDYLGPGTIGHCGECHSQVTNASAAYTFLRSVGQISSSNPTGSSLTVQGASRLVWFGGSMPDGGKASDASAQVLEAFRAWVAAGAKND